MVVGKRVGKHLSRMAHVVLVSSLNSSNIAGQQHSLPAVRQSRATSYRRDRGGGLPVNEKLVVLLDTGNVNQDSGGRDLARGNKRQDGVVSKSKHSYWLDWQDDIIC